MNNFSDIYGNDFMKSSLIHSIENNKVSHAYIFDGPAGSGKKMLANAFAKKLQCLEGHKDGCCCISCRTFDKGNHPDIFYISPEKKSSIGVDDIRDKINAKIVIKPYKYKYKIFIIDKADTLTPSAQNALLKTIEEPPPYGVFILLANNLNNFLQTIQSRCIQFKIRPLGIDQIKAYLADINVEENMRNLISAYSGGSIGAALKIIDDSEFIQFREEVLETVCSIENNNIAGAVDIIKKFDKYKDTFTDVLDILYIWYRDAFILKAHNSNDLIINSDKIDKIKEFSSRFTLEQLINGSEAILEAKIFSKSNANFQMNLSHMLYSITGIYANVT